MADDVLQDLVRARLAETPPALPLAESLVIAAFAGPDALGTALSGPDGGAAPEPVRARTVQSRPSAVYLAAIEVEGFRGVGPPSRLSLEPAPGLTLLVGRNGSGKSSFAEALETLLTGSSARWADRSKAWGAGWRNLHHERASVRATFAIDGRTQPLTIARSWPAGSDLAGAELSVDGKPAADLSAVGWGSWLTVHRPLLSHNELGRILDDGPTKLYDALASLLGLEELLAAQEALTEARRSAERAAKLTESGAAELCNRLAAVDDERASACLAALSTKDWDLESIEKALGMGMAAVDERSVLTRLRALATLPVTDLAEVHRVSALLRELDHELARLGGSDSAVARETAELLEQALRVHDRRDDRECPVCGTGGVITFEWRLRTSERIRVLRTDAAEADSVHGRVEKLRLRAAGLVLPPPRSLTDDPDVGIDTAPAVSAWQRWAAVPESGLAAELATHLDGHGPGLVTAVANLRNQARTSLDRREDAWRPVAAEIMEWLPAARRAQSGRARMRTLKAAEDWLKSAHGAIRNQRFRPIVDQVQANWTQLRQDSNVTLGALRLEGMGNRRQLFLDATVDGEAGSALGVMSQGELNCLALSLFLPRASMPESPFRFLVIDDPVQAMDPSKVEGLARVLESAAATRQVVVFTHDDRLPEAVRHLDIDATVIEVTRRERSVVELRRVLDPVQRYIDDALAIAASGLPPEIAGRVVPGYCRNAIEAACAVAVRRRMHGAGASNDDIERSLARPTTLLGWTALWRFDDPARAGDVMKSLNNMGLAHEADALGQCNRGSHGTAAADQRAIVRAAESLCERILESTGAAG